MAILFKVNNAPAWEQYFDNTKWETYPDSGSWNAGGWWDTQFEPLSDYLWRAYPIGDWEVGYRPSYIRATWTGGCSVMRILIRDDNNQYICNSGFVLSSNEQVAINFTTYDIQWMYISNSNNEDFDLTNIEFLP